MTEESPKPDKVVKMPVSERSSDGVVFRIGGQAFRIDVSVTDISDAPGAGVIPIDRSGQEEE